MVPSGKYSLSASTGRYIFFEVVKFSHRGSYEWSDTSDEEECGERRLDHSYQHECQRKDGLLGVKGNDGHGSQDKTGEQR